MRFSWFCFANPKISCHRPAKRYRSDEVPGQLQIRGGVHAGNKGVQTSAEAEKGVRAKGEFMQVRKGVLESRRRIHASKKASTVHACRKGCSCME